jgi:hypothetical protein
MPAAAAGGRSDNIGITDHDDHGMITVFKLAN